jgi:hypothetical protein
VATGQVVLQALQQPVADHPLGHRPEGVERVGLGERLVVGRLQREHSDLGAVAVRDHEFVLFGKRRQRRDRRLHVGDLRCRVTLFAAAQQGVAAQRNDDTHWFSSPGWRP